MHVHVHTEQSNSHPHPHPNPNPNPNPNPHQIPTAVFSHPPLAVMGLTEAQAIEKYGEAEVTTHVTASVNTPHPNQP